ncbi:MAG: hypothetical protein CR988_04610 [Treponema sp.]|nr:MAG: hypothetical protein CR988_04610 [Treponema sp.]
MKKVIPAFLALLILFSGTLFAEEPAKEEIKEVISYVSVLYMAVVDITVEAGEIENDYIKTNYSEKKFTAKFDKLPVEEFLKKYKEEWIDENAKWPFSKVSGTMVINTDIKNPSKDAFSIVFNFKLDNTSVKKLYLKITPATEKVNMKINGKTYKDAMNYFED